MHDELRRAKELLTHTVPLGTWRRCSIGRWTPAYERCPASGSPAPSFEAQEDASSGFLKRSGVKSHQIEPNSQRTSRQHNAKRPIGMPTGGALGLQGLGWTVRDVKGERGRSHRSRHKWGVRLPVPWGADWRQMKRHRSVLAVAVVVFLCGSALGCGKRDSGLGKPPMCANATFVGSVDVWPGWNPSGAVVYFLHHRRGPADSNCVAMVDTSGAWQPLLRVPDDAQELAYRGDGLGVVFGVGLELYYGNYSTGAVRPLTRGGHGCHWPRWNPRGHSCATAGCFTMPAIPTLWPACVFLMSMSATTDR